MNTKLEIIRAVGTVRDLTVRVREGGVVPETFAEALANLNAACAQVAARRRTSSGALASVIARSDHIPLDVEVEL